MSQEHGASQAVAEFGDEFIKIKTARKILGSNRVYAGAQVAKQWGVALTTNLPIQYTEADLEEAVRENAAGTADWRLVHVLGLWSLCELHVRCGVNSKSQLFFCKNNTWWLEASADKWASLKPMPGYYLLDFVGKWSFTSWEKQEMQIGSDFERANEVVLTEAVMSVFLLTGERLLETWYHWGPTLVSDDNRVCVGLFRRDDGWNVNECPSYCSTRDRLRVVRSRRFRS